MKTDRLFIEASIRTVVSAVIRSAVALGLVVVLPFSGGCKEEPKPPEPEATQRPPLKSTATAAVVSSTPVASAEPPIFGPTVTIPPGKLLAGSPACAQPRVTNEELSHVKFDMHEYRIDVLPYPNEPGKLPLTNVTRDEAAALCGARQKRLCSELEWERACKGPENKTFEYGDKYDRDACKPLTNIALSSRPKCTSAFGVQDMHGILFEWTSSAWARGQGSGIAAVRGNVGGTGILRDRCAAGIGRKPSDKTKDIGFRCCSGPENVDVVDLTIVKRDPMELDKNLDRSLAADLLKGMPADHRSVDQATVVIDKVWRWRPRDNEELLVARWMGTPVRGKPFFELAVFKACGGTFARLAEMKGPVESLGDPVPLANPEGMTATVRTRGDRGSVKFSYWYGSVKIEEPPFVKPGNQLRLDEDKKVPNLRPFGPLPKRK